MKKNILVAAMIGVTALATQAEQPAAAANSNASTLASFVDGPTGFRFVWRPDTGWEFAGQAITAPGQSEDGFEDKAPLAEFVDAATGFRFRWLHGAGWQFADQTMAEAGGVKQVSAASGELR